MDWKDVANKVAQVGLPTLGGLLAGQGGSIVGNAVAKLFGKAIGRDVTPDEFETILHDEQNVVRLKEIWSQHQIELEKIALQAEQVRLADVANARNREIELTKATGGRDINLYVLAWVIVIGFLSVTALMMFAKIPEGVHQALYLLLGALATNFGQVSQYFFGSSKSSNDKNKLLAVK